MFILGEDCDSKLVWRSAILLNVLCISQIVSSNRSSGIFVFSEPNYLSVEIIIELSKLNIFVAVHKPRIVNQNELMHGYSAVVIEHCSSTFYKVNK